MSTGVFGKNGVIITIGGKRMSEKTARKRLVDKARDEMREHPDNRYDPQMQTVINASALLTTEGMIDRLTPETLAAVVHASVHPAYRVQASIHKYNGSTRRDQHYLRDNAAAFGLLHEAGIGDDYAVRAVRAALDTTGYDDAATMVKRIPEQAQAILKVLAYFKPSGSSGGRMPPAVRKLVMGNPSIADDLVAFSRDRKLERMQDIDLGAFEASMSVSAPALRTGAL
jgi:hypothetical protein